MKGGPRLDESEAELEARQGGGDLLSLHQHVLVQEPVARQLLAHLGTEGHPRPLPHLLHEGHRSLLLSFRLSEIREAGASDDGKVPFLLV